MATCVESTNLLTQYQPLIQVIGGGLLTFIGGTWGASLAEKRKHAQEAKSLAFAFRGELIAIKAIVTYRKYLEILDAAVTHIKATNQPVPIVISVRQNYFNVFEKNVNKLGILPAPLPELIATFYTQSNSILEDMQTLKEGGFPSSPEFQIRMYEELRGLLFNSMQLIDTIAKEIEKTYP